MYFKGQKNLDWCNEGRRAGLGNGQACWARKRAKRFVSARRVPWNGHLTFRRYLLIAPLLSSFHSVLSLFCLRLETCTLKYRRTGLIRERAKRTRTFARCSFSPFYLCLVSCDVLQREGRPNGPFCFSFFFTGRRCHHSSSLAQPFPSSCWAWIFVSSLSDLPFLRTLFRREVLFVLTMSFAT